MSAKIYAAIYVKNGKVKEDLKTYFSRENIIIEKIFDNTENVRILMRSGSEDNLYHLHLEVHPDEAEKALKILHVWLTKSDGIQIHIAPCKEQ